MLPVLVSLAHFGTSNGVCFLDGLHSIIMWMMVGRGDLQFNVKSVSCINGWESTGALKFPLF